MLAGIIGTSNLLLSSHDISQLLESGADVSLVFCDLCTVYHNLGKARKLVGMLYIQFSTWAATLFTSLSQFLGPLHK